MPSLPTLSSYHIAKNWRVAKPTAELKLIGVCYHIAKNWRVAKPALIINVSPVGYHMQKTGG